MKRDKTFRSTKESTSDNWYICDATGVSLGRLASQVATVLLGKNDPSYTIGVPARNFVVVINSRHVVLTGNKENAKVYYSHSDYIGGLKAVSFQDMKEKHPERIVQKAVAGMLPKTKLGKDTLKKLKVVLEGEHPFEAQQPQTLELKGTRR